MNGSRASFLVERPRLEALARAGARKRLLLIVAPPGWGKTTLLLQTFKGGGPVLWHSVAQGEVGVKPAAGSLLRSVARFSSLGERSPDPGSSPLDHALELSALMERFFPDGVHVVIDGVDRSADRAPLVECIQGLVDHGPPRLHLVVSSTTALDLRLSRLAKRREVARIGQADLAFTPEEVASALEIRWGSEAAARLADEVFRMCAGWPAGMALLVMARPTPPEPCEPLLPGDSPREGEADPHRLIAALDPVTYRLLSFASLLPEFTSSLLAEMCGTADSALVIEDTLRHCPMAITTQGDFLIVSPVVREILREGVAHESPAAEVREALLRAAKAFEHCGRWEAAVELVLSAGSPAVASDILDRVGIRRILRKDTAAHIAWAKAFAASPDMGFAVHFLCGRAAQLSADYPAAAAHYRAALDAGQPHVGLTERLQILPNLLHALTMTGSAEAEAVEREILAFTPDSVETAGYCHLVKGTQLKNAGALREAEEELIKAIPVLRTAEQGEFLNSALNRLGETQTARAKYREALATLRAVSESPRRADLLRSVLRLSRMSAFFRFFMKTE